MTFVIPVRCQPSVPNWKDTFLLLHHTHFGTSVLTFSDIIGTIQIFFTLHYITRLDWLKMTMRQTRNGAQVHENDAAAFRYAAFLSTLSSLLRMSRIFCWNDSSQAYSFRTYTRSPGTYGLCRTDSCLGGTAVRRRTSHLAVKSLIPGPGIIRHLGQLSLPSLQGR